MQTLSGTLNGQADSFAATHWSVVLAAGETQTNPETAREALAQLCQTYWPPLYTYVRSQGHSVHDAQDLTQSFFAYFIERKIYARTDREKGKFRSFLLASLKNFLADARDREQTLKRGGRYEFVPLEDERAREAESLFQTHSSSGSNAPPEDRLFERSWAETLVATVLDRLAAAYKAEGRESVFEGFQNFLRIGPDPLPTYSALALRMAVPESTLRSYVTRLRTRYREMLRSEVRRTVNTDAEVDGELRELLRVLTEA